MATTPSKPVSGRASTPPRLPALTRRPVVGSVLVYRLTPDDARSIGHRRAVEGGLFKHSLGEPAGTVAQSGDVLPLLVTFAGESEVRGRVALDGDGWLWVTVRAEGTERGEWAWPESETTEG